jgi:hypothetical protein
MLNSIPCSQLNHIGYSVLSVDFHSLSSSPFSGPFGIIGELLYDIHARRHLFTVVYEQQGCQDIALRGAPSSVVDPK